MTAPTKRRRRTVAAPPPEPEQVLDDSPLLTETGAEADFSTDGIAAAAPKSGARKLADRLKSALLGGGDDHSDDDIPRAVVSKKRQDEMASQLMLFLAIVISLTSDSFFERFAPAYRTIGPEENEAKAISLPIARIIARRIKQATGGKISEDTLDYLMLITSITIYADRARDTAREISAAMKEREQHAVESTYNGFSQPFASQGTPHPTSQNRGIYGATQPQDGGSTKNDVSSSPQQNGTQHSGNARTDAEVMDELLRADAVGRVRRGLI